MLDEGAIATADGQAEVAELSLPPTLRLTILRRLSFLPEDTMQALRAASILGSGFSLGDLASVTGRPAMDLSLVLAEAIRAQVLEDDGAVLRFRHDLIRESIYADLPASVRQGLHREAGHRLAQAGAPSLQIAEHLSRGAAAGRRRGHRVADEGGPRGGGPVAGRRGGSAGAGHRADGPEGPGPRPGTRRIRRQPDAVRADRRGRGSLPVAARRDHDQSVAGAVRICLGQAQLTQGQASDALRHLERAASSPACAGHERTAAQAWASYARLALGDLDGASTVAHAARSAAVAAGDHLSLSIAMASLALVCEFRGQLADALQLIDEAVSLADQSPGRMGHRYPLHAIRGWLLIELDRPQDARSSLSTGRQLSEDLGVRWPLPTYQVFLAFERFMAGDWDDALTELQAASSWPRRSARSTAACMPTACSP